MSEERSAYARCEKCNQYLDRCECELLELRKENKRLSETRMDLLSEYESLKATVAGKDKMIAMLQDSITFWAKCVRDNMVEGAEQNDPEPQMLIDMEKALTATPSEVDEWMKLELGKARAEGVLRGRGYALASL